jgi:hypothetical protein
MPASAPARATGPAPAATGAARGRVAVVVGVVLTAALVALHLEFRRHAGPLWRDEVNGVNLIGMPSFGDVLANVHLDSFPYVWASVLRLWAVSAGDDDATLRLLGLVVGLATLGSIWWTGRRLGLDAPLVTLVLVGMNPSIVVYGDSVRGYGAGAMTVCWALGALWAFVQRPRRTTFALALVAAIVSVQTYFPNGVLLGAIGLGSAAVCARRRAWSTLAGVAAVGAASAASLALAAPWIRYAFEVGKLEQGEWPLGSLVGVFRGALAPEVPALAVAWIGAAIVAPIGWGMGMRSTAPGDTRPDVALMAAVTLPAALASYFAYLHLIARLPTQYWYYLSLMIVLALCLDVGVWLAASRVRYGPWLRVAAVGLAAVLGARDVRARVDVRMTNVDVVARRIASDARAVDLVVVVPWVAGITFQRYYAGAAPWITVPDMKEHRFHRHLEVAEKMKLGDDGAREELERVERTLRAGARVWVAGPLRAPTPGETVPRLVPAPGGPRGWRAAPYLDAWELRLGALLREHAGDVWNVPVPDVGPVNRWESLPLVMAEGWH